MRKEISKDALKKKWKWLFIVEEHVMVKILLKEGPASWKIVGYRISPGTKQFVFAQLHHIFSFTHCKSTSVRFIKIILDHHINGLIEQLFFFLFCLLKHIEFSFL